MAKPNINNVFEFRLGLRMAMDTLSQMSDQLERIYYFVNESDYRDEAEANTYYDERDEKAAGIGDSQLIVDIRHESIKINDAIERLNSILFEADKQEKAKMTK